MMIRPTFLPLAALSAFAAPAGAEGPVAQPAALYLRAGTIDTAVPSAPLRAARGAHPAGTRFVIQLDGPMTPQRRARLAAAGVRLGDYLPLNAYTASLDGADAGAVAGLEFIRWWSVYRPEWKLDPEVGARVHTTPERLALGAQGKEDLVVVLFPGDDAGATDKAIWAVPGALVLEEEPIAGHLEYTVRVDLAEAGRLTLIPGVQYVEPAPEATPRSNLTTRWIVQSNVAGLMPLYTAGLHGEGQIVGELDGRVDVNHCSFRDTNPIGPTHRKIVGMQSTGSGDLHGTHVAGIAVGDNNAEDNTRGVAYLGKLSWGTYGTGSAANFNTGVAFNRSKGATIHTNSWGNDGTTAYDALCRAIDDQTYTNESDMICFAVTNGTSLKNPENAKNVLAVGNTGDTPSQNTVCTGGAGPTSDGRRKPEIWAPGCNTLSSQAGTTCGTTALTGTSMACPAIAGTAMLVRQYYSAGYYPGGAPGGPTLTPSGALIRATLMNTGQNMAPPGYPSNAEGWGRVKIADGVFLNGAARKAFVQDVRNAQGLATAAQTSYPVTVLGSGQQLRITLSWTEPPATAGAANATINDLDLEVVSPGGATYLGNVFNAAGESQTGGTKDAKNNTEQVHISSPPTGLWTVRVKGGAVNVGTQGYALVVTGDIPSGAPAVVITLPTGIPSPVAPSQTFSFDVDIAPGSQTLVAGSAAAMYRTTTSGPFTSYPLEALGGTSFRATLPAPACAGHPQFYITAQGSEGGTATSPAGAPANVHTTQVGTQEITTVLAESFEQGLPGSWGASGLWTGTSSCAPGGSCAGGGTGWAYYGQPGSCNYGTAGANSGLLATPPIALPVVGTGGSIQLSYCSAKQTEGLAGMDLATVVLNGDTVIDPPPQTPPDLAPTVPESPSFTRRTVDLTPYAGQTVSLAWNFDTVDEFNNNFRGWHVDNVLVTATRVTCTDPPSPCYANCDSSTATPFLNVADFTCFLQKFAAADAYANCDGSTQPPTLNVADFTCFLQRFASGCSAP